MAEEHSIRPMRLADVEPAVEVMINGGWGDRRRFLRFCVEQSRFVPLVAEVTPAAAHELHLADGGTVFASVKATEIDVYAM